MSESSDVDILSHFLALDELIQLIYQGAHKFVVLSGVDDANWTVHVGLSKSDGRWWTGTWNEKDIRKFVGQKSSSIVLESFAERLAQTFVRGDLHIGSWSAEKGAEINLTLGPNAKTPIQMPLSELSPAEAASYATTVFTEIALQAQSRKSRLHPSGLSSTSVEEASAPSLRQLTLPVYHHKRKAEASPSTADAKAQDKIKQLEAELVAQKKIASNAVNAARSSSDGLVSKAKNAPVKAQPAKGASLANPNKKARKYQTLEFGSDDD